MMKTINPLNLLLILLLLWSNQILAQDASCPDATSPTTHSFFGDIPPILTALKKIVEDEKETVCDGLVACQDFHKELYPQVGAPVSGVVVSGSGYYTNYDASLNNAGESPTDFEEQVNIEMENYPPGGLANYPEEYELQEGSEPPAGYNPYGGMMGGYAGGGTGGMYGGNFGYQQKLNPATVPAAATKSPFEYMMESYMQRLAPFYYSFPEAGGRCSQYEQLKSDVKYSTSKKGTCGLSLDEYLMIKMYTGSGYMCLNSYLRQSAAKSPQILKIIDILNRALDKLPNYEGYVVRGASLNEEIRAQHKKGSTVKYDGFTSTSNQTGFGGMDMFLILSRTGKPVMGFSSLPGEQEVLFKSGTQFKVIDTYTKNSTNFYVMKEVIAGETQTEQEKEEKRILEELKTVNKDGTNKSSDQWYCENVNTKKNEPSIKQKTIPNIQHFSKD